MSLRLGFIAIAVAAAVTVPAWLGAAPASPPNLPGVRMNVVMLPSDPPGEVREAPGGGRVLSPGIVYTPAAGDNPAGPAIVMLDDGPGANPLEAGQATRFASQRLAARGYTVLSLYGSLERGFALEPFEDSAHAVRAALDYLELQGHEDLVLVGQSYGAIAVANYLATQRDVLLDNGGERRVKAAVLLNPLTEVTHYPRAGLDRDYAGQTQRAQQSFESGRGTYRAGRITEPGQGVNAKADPWIMTGPYMSPAEGFMSYWSPQAAERNAALLGKLSVPTLMLAGDRAPTVSIDTLRALRPPAPATLQVVAGGDMHFAGREEAVANDIARFLAAQGLAPKPRVRMQAVDAQAEDGRLLPGVLYLPDEPAAAKAALRQPAIVLLHGRTADIVQGSTHWMGWRLAQKGHAAFAPGLRISGVAGWASSSVAETAQDIGRWIDRVGQLGYPRVVLLGHSNGGIWLSNYLSLTNDRRVVGNVYIAPTRDSPAFARAQVGDAAYDEQVRRAEAAVARGDGWREPIGLLSAQVFLDNNGPNARTTHTQRVREFDRPALAIVGGKDPLMTPAFVDEFTQAYKGKLEVLRYPAGSHGFRESKDRLADDVDAWVRKTFDAAPRRVAR